MALVFDRCGCDISLLVKVIVSRLVVHHSYSSVGRRAIIDRFNLHLGLAWGVAFGWFADADRLEWAWMSNLSFYEMILCFYPFSWICGLCFLFVLTRRFMQQRKAYFHCSLRMRKDEPQRIPPLKLHCLLHGIVDLTLFGLSGLCFRLVEWTRWKWVSRRSSYWCSTLYSFYSRGLQRAQTIHSLSDTFSRTKWWGGDCSHVTLLLMLYSLGFILCSLRWRQYLGTPLSRIE